MITIECKKFSSLNNTWQHYCTQQITLEQAQQIIEVMKKRKPVQGFYQHSFKLGEQVFVIDTLHVDLKGFIESFKQAS
jgi:hypothetical protein